MLIASARTAATLAAQIDAIMARIAAIDIALANSAIIAGGSLAITDPVLSGSVITLVPQTVTDSATVFETMKTILQAKVDALNTQLAALS